MSIKVLLCGANGHMGKVISELSMKRSDISITAGYDINTVCDYDYPVYDSFDKPLPDADVMIDFSHPSAFDAVAGYAKSKGIPVVFATTGLLSSHMEKMKELSKYVPVFFSANMSLGVNYMLDLVKRLTKMAKGFDIEIEERHHRRKIDAPSGTALKIADAINEAAENKYTYTFDRESKRTARSDDEIGISALRGGTIVGEHTVIFAGYDEVIEIKHTAMSREIFAVGALDAAVFIKDKSPGFYGMNDLLEGD